MRRSRWLVYLIAPTIGALVVPPAAPHPFFLPVLHPAQLVTHPGGQNFDAFGWDVDVDGATLAVGAVGRRVNNLDGAGAVYVFARGPLGWGLQATLTHPSPGAGDEFGSAVALQGDTLLVGSPNDDVAGAPDAGSVHAFVRVGAAWALQQTLFAPTPDSNDRFGSSVALDGNTAAVGAFTSDAQGTGSGSAHIFVRTGSTWGLQTNLLDPSGAPFEHFGTRVALDGDRLLVGAELDDGAAVNAGSAHVFERVGTAWSHVVELRSPHPGQNEFFGRRLDLEGDTAVVAAIESPPPPIQVGPIVHAPTGSVHVFTRQAGAWAHTAELVPPDGKPSDAFGSDVSLLGDALLVGSPGYDYPCLPQPCGGPSFTGRALLYHITDAGWVLSAVLNDAVPQAGDLFGHSVDLSPTTAVAGIPFDHVLAPVLNGRPGRVAIFETLSL